MKSTGAGSFSTRWLDPTVTQIGSKLVVGLEDSAEAAKRAASSLQEAVMADTTAAPSQADETQQPQAGTDESQADKSQPEPQEAQEAPESLSPAEAKKLRSEASSLRRRLKEAEAEAEKIRQSSMSEQERAIAQAKAEGRAEVLREARIEVVRSEIKAAAAGRFREPSDVIDYLDLSKFLTEDGDVDHEAITTAVDRLAEGRQPFSGSFDGGARPTPPPQVQPGLGRLQYAYAQKDRKR